MPECRPCGGWLRDSVAPHPSRSRVVSRRRMPGYGARGMSAVAGTRMCESAASRAGWPDAPHDVDMRTIPPAGAASGPTVGMSGGGQPRVPLLWGYATASVTSAARSDRPELCRLRPLRSRHCSDATAGGDLDSRIAHHRAELDVRDLDVETVDGRSGRGAPRRRPGR